MSNQEFENYLLLISKLLQLNREQCEQISGELRDHLEMRVADLTSQGVSRQDSIRQAIEEFGDAAAMAKNFQLVNNLKRRRWMMRFATFSIVGIFLIAVCAISLWPGNARFGAPARSIAQSESGKENTDTQDENEQDSGLIGSEASQRNRMAELKLKEPCRFNYDETLFKDIMEELSQKTGLNLILSQSARDDSLSEDEPLTFNLVNVPLNRALNLMLESKNATYVIDNGVIVFISLDDSEDYRHFRLKVFDCKALVKMLPESLPTQSQVSVKTGKFGITVAALAAQGVDTDTTSTEAKLQLGAARLEEVVRSEIQSYLKANYPPVVPTREATLLNLVHSMVEPDSWSQSGMGLSEAKAVNGVLIVKHTESGLQQVENLLEDLERNLASQQGRANINGVPFGPEGKNLFRSESGQPSVAR